MNKRPVRKHAWLRRGGMAADVILTASFLVFILLPLFAVTLEQYLLLTVRKEISEALDMSCLAAYESIRVADAASGDVQLDAAVLAGVFNSLIQRNLHLDGNFRPLSANSLLQGGLMVRELTILSGPAAGTCSMGHAIRRLTVHAVVTGAYRTGLFDRAIMGTDGLRSVTVHRDVELPDDREVVVQ
jgi:hypothetical protein